MRDTFPDARALITRVIVERRELPRSEEIASLKCAGRMPDGPPAEREWKEFRAARTSSAVKV